MLFSSFLNKQMVFLWNEVQSIYFLAMRFRWGREQNNNNNNDIKCLKGFLKNLFQNWNDLFLDRNVKYGIAVIVMSLFLFFLLNESCEKMRLVTFKKLNSSRKAFFDSLLDQGDRGFSGILILYPSLFARRMKKPLKGWKMLLEV